VINDLENEDGGGVDILAQPPKTNMKNISALSGGEKALCAIALVMAILRIKPSPFCLLDEIDAALDDANTQRLCSYLNDIKRDNQFVIITHKRRTMEICDVLWGAGMGQDGSTRLAGVKLDDLSDKEELYV
jgi:chromosome segregation protein